MIISLVQECTKKNLKSFAKLYRKLYDDEYSSGAKIRDYIENDLDEAFEILIYIEDEKMVGCVYIERIHSFAEIEYDEDIFYISNLYVLKKYRRMGIANRLLEEVEKLAKKYDVKMIASDYNINNKASEIVHKNNGFVKVAKLVQVVKRLEDT